MWTTVICVYGSKAWENFFFQLYMKIEFRELLFVLDILMKGHVSLTIDKFVVIPTATWIESIPLNLSIGFIWSFNPGCNSIKIRFF